MRRRSDKKEVNITLRLYAVAAVFLVFCAVFAARLILYQFAKGDEYSTPVIGGNVRTETVPASRGDIRDRNGKVLVSDAYKINLAFNYHALPDTRVEVHRVFLAILDALEVTENADKMGKQYFPFEGTYPEYTFKSDALDPDSTAYARLSRFIKNNLLTDEITTVEDAIKTYSANDIAIYIADKYEIVDYSDKIIGGFSHFSSKEIDKLIRLRYDMELSGFGAASDYVFAYDADQKLVSYIAERHIRGVVTAYESERVYRYDGYASHILGYVGPIYAEEAEYYRELGYSMNSLVGKAGCEYTFEQYLHGTDGVLAIVEDDDGNVVDTYYIKEPIPGKNVYLTIDIDVQIAAENALRENIEIRINEWVGGKADSGAIVATDPDTGAILAIASYPTYDLSSFNADYDELSKLEVSPYLNRALLAYAPGSTFKVGMALAALEEGLITENTVIKTEGIYKNLACSHYTGNAYCCGNIDVEAALMVSCNYFFSKLGDDLSIDRIRRYSSLFGFGEYTGIELGESSGHLSQSLPHAAAIGQAENLCTPLQVSQYIAMISNGGMRYSAHLLYEVHEPNGGKIIKSEEQTKLGTLGKMLPSNIEAVKKGMYDVISGPDASSLVRNNFTKVGDRYLVGGVWGVDESGNDVYFDGKTVGGKTGTAETADSKAGKCSDNAWFTGFAPYDDPEIVVTCFIEKGITGGYASYAVSETMDAYFASVRENDSAVG